MHVVVFTRRTSSRVRTTGRRHATGPAPLAPPSPRRGSGTFYAPLPRADARGYMPSLPSGRKDERSGKEAGSRPWNIHVAAAHRRQSLPPNRSRGQPTVTEPWRAVAGDPPALACVRPAVAGCPPLLAGLRPSLAERRERFPAIRRAWPASRRPPREPGQPLPASRRPSPAFGNPSPKTGSPSRRPASLGRRSASVSRCPRLMPGPFRMSWREGPLQNYQPDDFEASFNGRAGSPPDPQSRARRRSPTAGAGGAERRSGPGLPTT